MEQLDTLVVGAGVVGLAVGRALAQSGREVMILERHERFGEETSARNSEVVHAGIYYPTGSLKARLCVEGNRQLYTYAQQRGVPFRRCGKLIVASQTQTEALMQLQAQAKANGATPLQWRDRSDLAQLEPALRADQALFSPATGIIDSHALMTALAGDAEHAGAMLVTAQSVIPRALESSGVVVEVEGECFRVRQLVNAAGLNAVNWARTLHGDDAAWLPQAHFARGHYFSLSGRTPFRHLIYPLPEPGGLGVHLTLDLQARARFGPDVQWLSDAEPDEYPLTVDPARADAFVAGIRQWWPDVPAQQLQPDYAGIRPKLVGPGEPNADFLIADTDVHGVPGLIHLLGIESPGLTSCLALADEVVSRLDRAD